MYAFYILIGVLHYSRIKPISINKEATDRDIRIEITENAVNDLVKLQKTL